MSMRVSGNPRSSNFSLFYNIIWPAQVFTTNLLRSAISGCSLGNANHLPVIYIHMSVLCSIRMAAAFLLSRFSHEGATLHGHMDLSRSHRIVAAAVIVLCLSSDQLVMLICLVVLFILLGRSWGTHNKSVR